MPLFTLRCDACGRERRRILPRSPEPEPCGGECSGQLRRAPAGPSQNVVERLDNGSMVKALERPAEAERLYRERADPAKPPKE